MAIAKGSPGNCHRVNQTYVVRLALRPLENSLFKPFTLISCNLRIDAT